MILYYPQILNFNVWSCKASLAFQLVFIKSLINGIEEYEDEVRQFLTSGYLTMNGEVCHVDK